MENAAVQERAQAPHMLTGAQRFYIGVKRAADVALSLLGLVLLSPVLLAIGIAIVLDDGFPVLSPRGGWGVESVPSASSNSAP